MKHYPSLLFSLVLSAFCTQSLAVQIVRIQLDYNNTSTQTLDLELFDTIAPNSVANFLNYVSSATGSRYDNTFITRSIPGFILQTGSYTFRPVDPLCEILRPIGEMYNCTDANQNSIPVTSALEALPTDGPINSEFQSSQLSNIRGTIAYALLANDPNSATSGWFINLDDNSANLDVQNGGFTVFGSVIDDGMVIADEMASFPIHPQAGFVLGSDFSNLPVVNFDFSTFPGVFRSNLIMLTSFTIINRPIIRLTPSPIDFQLDIAGDGVEKLITTTLKNTGNEALLIGAITNLSIPFNIKTDGCSGVTLEPQSINATSTCDIVVSFSPTLTGVFTDQLTIPYTSTVNGAPFSVSYSVTGEGVPAGAVSTVSVTDITYDDTVINSITNKVVTVRNKGGSALTIVAVNLIGTESNQFTIDNSACVNNIAMNETCDLIVSFSPSTTGIKSASLEVITNSNTSNVTLNGTATKPVLSVQSSVDLFASVNQTAYKAFDATNIGTGNLIFNSISISGLEAGFFTKLTNCIDANGTGILVGGNQFCSLIVEFTPTDTASRTATLTVTTNDPITPTFAITLNGSVSDAIISAPSTFDVGTSQINGISSTKELIITNTGLAPLEISSITGLSTTDFSQINNCIGTGGPIVQLAQNETCSVLVTLSSTTPGASSATLTITSNDPVTPTIKISISGFGDTDSDGIVSSIELAAPNAGDGNNDGITDDLQSNVATFVAPNSNYITFISDNSLVGGLETSLVDIVLVDIAPAGEPATARFDYGLYSYSIKLPTAGDGVNMAILLPAYENPTTFYKYGPTTDNTTPHWYDFSYEETTGTGAQFFGQVTYAGLQKNLVIVSYIDGQRGDDDLQQNGSILNSTSGLSFSNNIDSGSSSGSMTYMQIFILLIISICRKRFVHIKN